MIDGAGIRMQQFGRAVRGAAKKAPLKVNWDLLERRIAAGEKTYRLIGTTSPLETN